MASPPAAKTRTPVRSGRRMETGRWSLPPGPNPRSHLCRYQQLIPARALFLSISSNGSGPILPKNARLSSDPKGFSAVQVSPPNEHIRPQDAPDLAWWVRYQPVSYQLESRSGSRAEFIDMVQRCGAVGVGVYVDAVINHMTGGESGVGVAGTRYTHYEYPDLDGTGRYGYGYEDFHHCGRPFDDIGNYGDAWEVQTCELSNLADLDTGSPYVQERIAAYLQDLVDIGVAGFRLDAAKHMASGDIAAILGRVQGDPYVFQEVIDRGGEGVSSGDYLANGDITEFNFGSKVSEVFLGGQLAGLESFGESWGLLPSASAVAFIDNHDNQRGHGGGGPLLTHRDGGLYNLAEVFMLAWPYGYPRIMSSYAWDGIERPHGTALGRARATPTPSTSTVNPTALATSPARIGSASIAGRPSPTWWVSTTPRRPTSMSATGGATVPSRSPLAGATLALWSSTGKSFAHERPMDAHQPARWSLLRHHPRRADRGRPKLHRPGHHRPGGRHLPGHGQLDGCCGFACGCPTAIKNRPQI